MTHVVYPGTFDPITYGHLDLVRRASKFFDKVTLAIAASEAKKPIFSVTERENLARRVFASEGLEVNVVSFRGLLVDCLRTLDGQVILRGLRAISDFEYELQLANTNRVLLPYVETLFLTPAVEYAYISSSMVREIALLGGNVRSLVPQVVVEYLEKHVDKVSRTHKRQDEYNDVTKS